MREDIKKKALRRLNIISGQIEGLKRMIKEEKYCPDILIQSMAIKEALSSLEDLILENHFRKQVIQQIKNNKENKVIQELIRIYKLSKRK